MAHAIWSKRIFDATQGNNPKAPTSLAAGTYYTRAMSVGEFARLAAHFKWGLTTGTIRLQTSNDPAAAHDAEGASAGSGDWYDEALTPPVDPAGSAGKVVWHISDVNSTYVRFKIVVSLTTANWFGWLHAKN